MARLSLLFGAFFTYHVRRLLNKSSTGFPHLGPDIYRTPGLHHRLLGIPGVQDDFGELRKLHDLRGCSYWSRRLVVRSSTSRSLSSPKGFTEVDRPGSRCPWGASPRHEVCKSENPVAFFRSQSGALTLRPESLACRNNPHLPEGRHWSAACSAQRHSHQFRVYCFILYIIWHICWTRISTSRARYTDKKFCQIWLRNKIRQIRRVVLHRRFQNPKYFDEGRISKMFFLLFLFLDENTGFLNILFMVRFWKFENVIGLRK